MYNWLKHGAPWYFDEKKPLPIHVLTHFFPNSNTIDNRFASFDSPDLFEKNLKIQNVNWHYRFKEIIYNINDSGYRTKEWLDIDWENSIVLLGCSTAFGIGVAYDETIAYHLEQLTGKFVVNMGAPAGSNNFLFYNSMLISKNYPTPYAVVHVWTGLDRFVFFNEDDIKHSGIWNMDKHDTTCLIGDGCNPIIHAKFLSLASRLFWEEKTNYYHCSFFEESSYHLGCDYVAIDNKSRDLIHPGRNCTKVMAELISYNLK